MPPMARMDDYDRCFLDIPEGATATFCMVTSLIKPNESSDIWNIINVRNVKIREYHFGKKEFVSLSFVHFEFRLNFI